MQLKNQVNLDSPWRVIERTAREERTKLFAHAVVVCYSGRQQKMLINVVCTIFVNSGYSK